MTLDIIGKKNSGTNSLRLKLWDKYKACRTYSNLYHIYATPTNAVILLAPELAHCAETMKICAKLPNHETI